MYLFLCFNFYFIDTLLRNPSSPLQPSVTFPSLREKGHSHWHVPEPGFLIVAGISVLRPGEKKQEHGNTDPGVES